MASLDFNKLLQQLPTIAVLETTSVAYQVKGNYAMVDCPECEAKERLAICTRGDKHNLCYCIAHKRGMNLLQYVSKTSGQPIRTVAELLARQVLKIKTTDQNKPLELELELAPHTYPERICSELGIGYCKKGILAGHLCFEVTMAANVSPTSAKKTASGNSPNSLIR